MFKPFEKGTESHAIHDLTLENDLDHINLYGNLQINKDQDGLLIAKTLQAFFNDVVRALEQEKHLPEKIETAQQGEIENPFL